MCTSYVQPGTDCNGLINLNYADPGGLAVSNAWVCDRSLAGISGSNPIGGMDVCLLCMLCVLSGKGLCDGPITRPDRSPNEFVVSECDLETSTRRPRPTVCFYFLYNVCLKYFSYYEKLNEILS